MIIAVIFYTDYRNNSDYQKFNSDSPIWSDDDVSSNTQSLNDIYVPPTSPKLQVLSEYIDFNNFDEKRMSDVLFKAMNDYQKKIHNGDSLIRSSVVERIISRDNYYYFKNNCDRIPSNQMMKFHNPKWYDIDRDGNPDRIFNDLPDTVKVMLINEMRGTYFLQANWDPYAEDYILSYGEIVGSVSFENLPMNYKYTYYEIAKDLINGWNKSIHHTHFLNGDYKNAVVVGVAAYYYRKNRTVYVSFVYIS